MEDVHDHSQSGEEGGEGLAVLPRHTRVLVTGNNRTKSVLVGLQGVVTKAVGLGGWHWLASSAYPGLAESAAFVQTFEKSVVLYLRLKMLTNGDEVKLQRNALSVIEAPTGHEHHAHDDDDEEENPFSCQTSLVDKNYPRNSFRVHPRKPALPTSSNPGAVVGTDSRDERRQRLSSKCLPLVNLSKLETAILKRYRSHFKLVEVGPNSSKEQLVDAVVRHFMSQELDEGQVIMGFMQAAKRLRT